jgi:hypothetical protein
MAENDFLLPLITGAPLLGMVAVGHDENSCP